MGDLWSLPVGIVLQVVLTSVVFVGARWHLRRKGLGPKQLNPHPELDQWGYRVDLDWKHVAGREHELGFVHMGESKKHCGLITCWQETESPKYEMVNGFLTIASYPELPAPPKIQTIQGGTFTTGSVNATQIHIGPISAASSATDLVARVKEKKQEERKLRDDLAARKSVGENYFRDGMTANEARERHGYQAPSRALASLQADDKWHSQEFEKLEDMIKERLSQGKTMVLPAGYEMTWKRGGELAHIESPTGLSVWIDVEAYRKNPTLSVIGPA